MSIENEKDQLVIQLTRETIENNLQWNIEPVPLYFSKGTDKVVHVFYQSKFKGVNVGLYEVRYQEFTDVDEYHWAENLGICIISNDDKVVWNEEEYSPALRELFQMAREQASGLSRLIKS